MPDEQVETNAETTAEAKPADRPYIIVVGVTFDSCGTLALREAVRLAGRQPNAEIHAVHVLPPAAGLRKTRSIGRAAEALARDGDALFRFVFDLVEHEPAIADERLRLHTLVGTPTDALVQHTIDAEADLLVVGTHGRTGVAALVLGSTAQDLVRRSRCPVLVARPRDYQGAQRSLEVEPLCADCAEARAASGGEALWCEWHARPHVKTHVYGDGDRVGLPYTVGVVSNGG